MTGQQAHNYGNPPPTGNAFMGTMFGVPPPPDNPVPMRDYRAHALGQPFNLRARFKVPKPLLGPVLGMPSAAVARLMAGVGYDFICLDWEHTPFGVAELVELIKWIHYASEGTCATIVRVPGFDKHYISWALDAGASAIIVPHCETVEQVEGIVKNCRFPLDHGHRSFPPFAVLPGINDGAPEGKSAVNVWNDHAAIIVQIESRKAVENVDALAAVPGVDGLMIGSGDLRMDLGLGGGMDGPEEIYNDCITTVLKAAKKHGDMPVLHFAFGPDAIKKRLGQGFRILGTQSDVTVLATGLRQDLTMGRKACAEFEAERSENENGNGH